MKKLLVLCFAGILATACGNGSDTEAAQSDEVKVDEVSRLKKEIMVVHDKTMAEMNTMASLRRELKAASAETQDTAAYYNAYQDLHHAHEDMMNWMHEFQNPDEMEVSEEEKVEYLKGQKLKVEQLEEYTQSSIEKARKVLKK